ncbi:TPA: TolC family outer membrane protein [Providencia rettgeri]|nr:TolC family outer membrane protein [Providencia rettgeri]
MYITTAVQKAVVWYPSVHSSVANLQQSAESIDVADAGYFPQIRAGMTSEFNNDRVERYGSKDLHKASVSVSQMLYDFGKVSGRVDRAQALYLAAQAKVLLSVDQVAKETAHAVLEVQRYHEQQILAKEQIAGIGTIADLVRQRRAMGASTLSDETQAKAREDAALASSLQIRALSRRWEGRLSQLIGLSPLPEVLPQIPAELSMACISENSELLMLPAVMIAEAEQQVAKAEFELSGAEILPTLSLEGSVSRDLNNQSVVGSRNEASVMVNVSAPLYQGGGLQASRRAASYALGAANAEVTASRLSVSQELTDAQTMALGYEQRLAVLRGRIDNARQTRDLYRQQYLDLGTRSFLDLLNAEQEYHQSRIELSNNQYDLHRMRIDCLYSTGQLRKFFDLNDLVINGVTLQP